MLEASLRVELAARPHPASDALPRAMLSFACGHCGHLVFFENFVCLNCGTAQGFVPERLELVALEGERAGLHRCVNAQLTNCNWMVPSVDALCRSCELTSTRPNDNDPVGMAQWVGAEAAKRRVIFQLLDLGLPKVDASHLSFKLLSSVEETVTTGHADGVITVDLAESDDAHREQRREQLDEPYRTMLGHLRHELGHYFQPLLIVGDDSWHACRALFGDERADYQAAIDRHYEQGAPADWENDFVSAYATMHPWEDWAETFAHYLHIRDTLQTAAQYGVSVRGPVAVTTDRSLESDPRPQDAVRGFAEIMEDWLPLTYALNAINRSMGEADLYPFVLAPNVVEKLSFVHERVRTIGTVS
jgi:hypothetical protein